jgi:hypothetical protein
MDMIMEEPFIEFLITAKLHTYASQGDAASVTPLLPGSHQLEYRQGDWFYRDIYFGGDYFVGQETVYHTGKPLWSMAYAGGALQQGAGIVETSRVYAFLQAALRAVPMEAPFRGPNHFQEGAFIYLCEHDGDVKRFWGREVIQYEGHEVYELRFSGGRLI